MTLLHNDAAVTSKGIIILPNYSILSIIYYFDGAHAFQTQDLFIAAQ